MIDKFSGATFSLYLKTIGPYKKRLLLVLFLVLLDTALASMGVGLVLPVFQALLNPQHESVFLSDFFITSGESKPEQQLVILAVITILVFLFKAIIAMITVIVINDFIQKLRFYWVDRIGENFLQAPLLSLSGCKQGELLNDWFNETLVAARFYKTSLNYLSSTVLAIALLGLGLFVNWQAMMSMLVIGAIVAIVIGMLTYKRSSILSKDKLRVNQALNSSMVEDLANVRDLKLMSAETRRLQKLSKLSNKLKSIFISSAVLAEIPKVSGEFLAVSFLMGFILVSNIMLDMSPQILLPMMAFFFIAFYRLVTASSIAMASRVRALNDQHSVFRVQELLEKGIEKEVLDVGLPLVKINSDIQFKNVIFRYDSENKVLNNVDAIIPKGKLTLLVGPSGSGKSTMLDLLMRLVEPTSGEIQVDEQPASEYSLSDWRSCFGYVSQEASLFNGAIRMNMQLAKPSATEEEIQKACQLAGASNFINELPDGYDTAVGDRGFSLSGGQRKRIAIARALIRKPSVLILDEATTSFEQELEQELLSGLKNAMPDLTIIQVTHRIQISDNVDWIIVVENGNVIACDSSKNVILDNYKYK